MRLDNRLRMRYLSCLRAASASKCRRQRRHRHFRPCRRQPAVRSSRPVDTQQLNSFNLIQTNSLRNRTDPTSSYQTQMISQMSSPILKFELSTSALASTPHDLNSAGARSRIFAPQRSRNTRTLLASNSTSLIPFLSSSPAQRLQKLQVAWLSHTCNCNPWVQGVNAYAQHRAASCICIYATLSRVFGKRLAWGPVSLCSGGPVRQPSATVFPCSLTLIW